MKINKVYIYLLVLVVAVAAVIIIANISGSKTQAPELADGAQAPNDETHSGMGSSGESASNVRPDIREKMENLEKTAKENPNDTSAQLEYAEFMAMAHQTDKAIEGYKNYLKINLKNVDVLQRISSLYYQKQDFKEATNYLDQALKLDPNNAETIFYSGVLKEATGDHAGAKSLWEKVVKEYSGTEAAKLAEEQLKH